MSSIEPSDDRLRREEGSSPRVPGNVPFFPADCLGRYCDGTLSAEETAALERQLRDDPQALESFVLYMEIHSQIAWNVRARSDEESGRQEAPDRRESGRWAAGGQSEIAPSPVAFPSQPSSIPPIVLDLSPSLHSPLFTLQSPLGSFLFSYTAAALILGLAFLIGWAWKIHYDRLVVQDMPRHASGTAPPETPLVGRITGAVDCVWTDPGMAAFDRDGVPLGGRYALRSGFLEITYHSGARVILQGPVTYVVESAQGGFLSLGKLTARVERQSAVGSRQSAVSPRSESLPTAHYPLPTDRGSKGERTANLTSSSTGESPTASLAPRPSADASGRWPVASGQWEKVRNPKSETSNPQSPIPNPLFFVRTPTAVVTDLGTEFGVEVANSGATRSHVFLGRVEVCPTVGGRANGHAVQLGANESVSVAAGQSQPAPITVEPGQMINFVRRMPARLPAEGAPTTTRPASALSYRLTDLGTLGGAASRAYDINAVGQVAGSADLAGGVAHAFLYDGGKMKDLDPAGTDASYAFRVNNSGKIVGSRQFQRPAAPPFSTAAAS